MASRAPLLVILDDTGERRGDLPVLAPHGDPGPYLATLTRGFSGSLLRVHSFAQRYVRNRGGREPEPAYLLLAGNEGGFARSGFHLGNDDKRGVGYVDLHKDMEISGGFGALDQIFPHELGHVLMRQMAGPKPEGGSNQAHAIGVRTDPETALVEGFAEHLQVMAVDDPDADPSTSALRDGVAAHRKSEETASVYAEELLRGPSPLPGLQAAFPWWFSKTEQVLRYCAVKSNAFAREPRQVDALLDRGAVYEAYLVANTVPGADSDIPKRPGVLLSSEGVIASLFVRWVGCSAIRDARPDASFFKVFGIDPAEVSPLENAYLKLFYVLGDHRPRNAREIASAYASEFPDESEAVDSVVSEVTCGGGFSSYPEIWLANPDFQVGTSVFDQYRVLPRIHTFDLNAASLVDLCSVPGVDKALAARIAGSTPYRSVTDLRRLQGVSDDLVERLVGMQSGMDALRRTRETTEEMETKFMASVGVILSSYAGRGNPR